MKYQFQLGVYLVLILSASVLMAADRDLSGNLSGGIFDTYGELTTSGSTTVLSGAIVIFRTMESSELAPGFSIELGGKLGISSLKLLVTDAWKLLHFNTLDIDLQADPDGDGIINLIEFEFGTDPNLANTQFVDSDSDGLADSWEIEKYGDLSHSGTEDPDGDGQTIATNYQDFLDYLYTNAVLYIEGTLESRNYGAIEIQTSDATLVPNGATVYLSKSENVKIFHELKVQLGGELIISSMGPIPVVVEKPEPPENIKMSYPGNAIVLSWDDNTEFDVISYKIYRNDALLTPAAIDQLSFTDSNVTHNTTYSYQVSAVDKSGKESDKSPAIVVTADFVPPNLISVYPANGGTISSDGTPLFVLSVYGDDGTGIASIRLIDDDTEKDITQHAIIKDGSVELLIVKPETKSYSYSFVVKDHGENILNHQLAFDVNAEPLVTTVSVPGGRYNTPQTIDMACSQNGTIHYTTDGYPPIVGQSLSGQAPVTGITINQNTSLQFFAVDQSGNRELTKSEVYIFNNDLLETTGLTATYQDETDTTPRQVMLTWTPVSSQPVQGYKIYRCNNAVECDVLAKSRIGKYLPPSRFSITPSVIIPSTHTDTALTVGSSYKYGVLAIDNLGLPGLLSPLVSVEVTSDEIAEDLAEAIDRATAWIRAQQDITGYWGEKEELKLLATSKALDALKASDVFDVGIYSGVFFLRGHFADNNDFLSRKILTLDAYNQNTDETVNRLISQSNIDSENVNGWGLNPQYLYDALDTSLGLLASLTADPAITNNQSSTLLSTGTDILSSEGAGHYGWVAGYDTSIFVTALAHHAMEESGITSLPDRSWVFNLQEANGSFANSLIDTAAVLLWLTPGDTVKNDGVGYLLLQQELNGSWSNDVYLTGLCLEALLEGLSE